ncbi:hypothetical protein CERZMDRAFT_91886 [Cercospora zeae-maydis SCOH1-5]|uniref:Uncharacterized protein n=1 Tax=Cercospora zeae-maydis SCOH1-5 TaxID=717836 RepID=A0A6A6F2U6_9PEZI|nr:hypothetical protein CERZMDRAFT_91886 [Cercospora zeae-maydis SCOH1-5]
MSHDPNGDVMWKSFRRSRDGTFRACGGDLSFLGIQRHTRSLVQASPLDDGRLLCTTSPYCTLSRFQRRTAYPRSLPMTSCATGLQDDKQAEKAPFRV